VVIEHNMDLIRQADYIIDLGPEGGEEGGRIVVQGDLETIMKSSHSYTGQYLRKRLGRA
jgi:excinuclease ABC subunit A